jgi:hypothetical protein
MSSRDCKVCGYRKHDQYKAWIPARRCGLLLT